MTYLLASLLWGLAGFVAGLVVGHILNERPHISTGAFLMLLAGGVIVTSVVEQAQREQDIDCQIETNNAFRDALVERATVTNEDRDALKRLVNNIGKSMRTDDPQAIQGALEDYRNVVAANEAARSETPLPDPNACD